MIGRSHTSSVFAANRRTAFDFAANDVQGNPDGMTIDSDENLWVACFGGNQVRADFLQGKLKPHT